MDSLNNYIREYKKQLAKGDIKKVYQGIIYFLMKFRLHMQKKYPELHVTSSINQGIMDVSYFAFSSDFLKKRKLKIVLLFKHDSISFEAWLCGFNKKIQQKYWEFIKASGWDKYRIADSLAGNYSIIEHLLNESPDFDNQDGLMEQMEDGIIQFLEDIENHLDSQ